MHAQHIADAYTKRDRPDVSVEVVQVVTVGPIVLVIKE